MPLRRRAEDKQAQTSHDRAAANEAPMSPITVDVTEAQIFEMAVIALLHIDRVEDPRRLVVTLTDMIDADRLPPPLAMFLLDVTIAIIEINETARTTLTRTTPRNDHDTKKTKMILPRSDERRLTTVLHKLPPRLPPSRKPLESRVERVVVFAKWVSTK